jgi:hypothetical protein
MPPRKLKKINFRVNFFEFREHSEHPSHWQAAGTKTDEANI